ncbi:MAG: HTTM domain-containing protein [Bacteroidota bacterium]|nr:HTTM domain-containing protein [Bacteroidota bacterium]
MFRRIDNAPLIVFRIFFGLLLALESFGSILTGWVYDVFVEPELHFQHIGFEWLVPLSGVGMYVYYCLMGVLGVMVMLGYRYRASLGLFTLMWIGVYLMQKSAYNNHYYMLILVCLIMLFLPANKYASVDVRKNPSIRSLDMPIWCSWVMILQLAIVYFYATWHKFYPDWLNGTFTGLLFSGRFPDTMVGELFMQKWFHLFIAYMGIVFDALVVPLLLWRKTRNWALLASLIFHLFNSIVLQIGIFPYFALSFSVFFYNPDTIRDIFLRKKTKVAHFQYKKEGMHVIKFFFVPFFIIQTLLPLRHYLIQGDVLWTDEGHRLSWRMMLRARDGFVSFTVLDKKTKEKLHYNIYQKIKGKQLRLVSSQSDGIWQMAQHIKREYAKQGKEVEVYAKAMVSVNGHPHRLYTDPEVDLAAVDWRYFRHSNWVKLYNE